MTVTNDYITQEGLDFIANEVTSYRRLNDSALRLDDRRFPTYNWLVARSQDIHSVDGGYRTEVKGNRDQEEEAWDGADVLTFENHITPFPLKFKVGKTHYGNTEQYDFLERLGISIRYGAKPGDKGSPKAAEVVLNYLTENYDDIMESKRRSRARRIMRANTDKPKFYEGVDALLPVTSNSTGTIGGADRSFFLLQHILVADVDPTNLWLTQSQINRELNRYSAGSSMRFVSCGDNYFDMLVSIYQPNANGYYGGAALGRGFDIRLGYEQAAAYANKFKIGLPGEAFVDPEGNLIVNDQVYRDLDEIESPAIPWSDRCYHLSEHLRLYVEKSDEYVNHGMARDQVVCHESWFHTMALVLRAPRSCAVQYRKV
jgi:hypothetical protein